MSSLPIRQTLTSDGTSVWSVSWCLASRHKSNAFTVSSNTNTIERENWISFASWLFIALISESSSAAESPRETYSVPQLNIRWTKQMFLVLLSRAQGPLYSTALRNQQECPLLVQIISQGNQGSFGDEGSYETTRKWSWKAVSFQYIWNLLGAILSIILSKQGILGIGNNVWAKEGIKEGMLH